jgi:hypothetical protein
MSLSGIYNGLTPRFFRDFFETMQFQTMQLEFVPVEDFYFALTLAVRTLEEVDRPNLVREMGTKLAATFGQSSTVAAANQNNYNYVFKVSGIAEAPDLVVSVADWQDKLRLSSDYGWMLDADRKPVKTPQNPQRSEFNHLLKAHLQELLGIQIDP